VREIFYLFIFIYLFIWIGNLKLKGIMRAVENVRYLVRNGIQNVVHILTKM